MMARFHEDDHMSHNSEVGIVYPKAGGGSERRGTCIQSLPSRWSIVKGLAYLWHRPMIFNIMYACIIMHNIIVENEGEMSIHGPSKSTLVPLVLPL